MGVNARVNAEANGEVNGSLSAGEHSAYWDGRDEAGRRVAAGVYYYSFNSGSTSAARQMVLTR